MLLELQQPLPMETPKGAAFARFVIDYGTEHHLIWVCFLKDSGECWSFQNPEIRLAANETFGTRKTAPLSGSDSSGGRFAASDYLGDPPLGSKHAKKVFRQEDFGVPVPGTLADFVAPHRESDIDLKVFTDAMDRIKEAPRSAKPKPGEIRANPVTGKGELFGGLEWIPLWADQGEPL
jgi:hypothetical protein